MFLLDLTPRRRHELLGMHDRPFVTSMVAISHSLAFERNTKVSKAAQPLLTACLESLSKLISGLKLETALQVLSPGDDCMLREVAVIVMCQTDGRAEQLASLLAIYTRIDNPDSKHLTEKLEASCLSMSSGGFRLACGILRDYMSVEKVRRVWGAYLKHTHSEIWQDE